MTGEGTFIGNVNELVAAALQNTPLNYDAARLVTNYTDKNSYVYNSVMKVIGEQLATMSNLQNFLSEWERTESEWGGFVRNLAVAPVLPMNPPSFLDGSDPGAGIIRKSTVLAQYMPLKIRPEFKVSTFSAVQLGEAFSGPDSLAQFLVQVAESMASGVNDTMFQIYKELFHAYYINLTSAQQSSFTVTGLPEITNRETAIQFVSRLRDIKDELIFGTGAYSSTGFRHSVQPDNIRIYIRYEEANKISDFLKLNSNVNTQGAQFGNTAQSVSDFLEVPVRKLNGFGGDVAYDAGGAELFPIYTPDGAVTGAFAATEGGTTPVAVDHFATDPTYSLRAIVTEESFGNVLIKADTINTMFFAPGGGYTNTFRYTDRIMAPNPHSNTIYIK